MHYNFVRIHKTLRTTPATAAKVTERLWEIGPVELRAYTERFRTADRARCQMTLSMRGPMDGNRPVHRALAELPWSKPSAAEELGVVAANGCDRRCWVDGKFCIKPYGHQFGSDYVHRCPDAHTWEG